MTARPRFLTLAEVIGIHDKELATAGGASGVRDRGALESALGAVQATFAGHHLMDIFEMAVMFVLVAITAALAGPSFGTLNGSFDLPVPSNDTGGGWETWNIGSTGGWRADSGHPGAMFALAGTDSGGTVPTIRQLQSGWPAASHYLVVYFCARDSSCLVVPLVVNIHGSTAAIVYGHGIGVWDSTSVAVQAPAEPFYITLQTSAAARYLVDNVQRREPKIDDVAVRASRPGQCPAQRPQPAPYAVTLNGRAIMPCGCLGALTGPGTRLIGTSRGGGLPLRVLPASATTP